MNWVEFYAMAVVVSLFILLYLEVEWREEPRPLYRPSPARAGRRPVQQPRLD